jgi:hypothetical protein
MMVSMIQRDLYHGEFPFYKVICELNLLIVIHANWNV